MACPLCDDTGWKPDTTTGPTESRDEIRRVVRCDCWREKVGKLRLAGANIPKRYQHCTIENFTVYNESLERAAHHLLQWIDDREMRRHPFLRGLDRKVAVILASLEHHIGGEPVLMPLQGEEARHRLRRRRSDVTGDQIQHEIVPGHGRA